MEEKKIRSQCEFIEFKNDELNCKCKKCGKNTQSQKNEAIKSFPICINFTLVTLINFCLYKKRWLSL